METVVVTDDYGRNTAVPKRPQRVVSLSPSVTEIMYAIGADSLLVGRTDFCTFPPQCQTIPSIGGISNLNVEQVAAQKPDLIISGSMVNKKNSEQFDELGIPIVFVIEKPVFTAIYDNISTIGQLVGHEQQADSLNRLLKSHVDSLPHTHSEQHTCYYVVGYGPGGNFTAGGNTYINDILNMAGCRNIADGVEGWSYSLEALMQADPEYIIIRRQDSAGFVNTRPYSSLTAVKEGKVIGMESSTIDLQVPRNIDAIKTLRKRISQTAIR